MAIGTGAIGDDYAVDGRRNIDRVTRRRNYRFSEPFTDATGQAPIAASIAASGTTVTVTFDVNVDSESAYDFKGVIITVNGGITGISAVAETTTALAYTINTTLSGGDEVTVRYDGTGDIAALSSPAPAPIRAAHPEILAPAFALSATAT